MPCKFLVSRVMESCQASCSTIATIAIILFSSSFLSPSESYHSGRSDLRITKPRTNNVECRSAALLALVAKANQEPPQVMRAKVCSSEEGFNNIAQQTLSTINTTTAATHGTHDDDTQKRSHLEGTGNTTPPCPRPSCPCLSEPNPKTSSWSVSASVCCPPHAT